MTDKAKALGLPTDQEIEEILTPLTPQSKGFYFEQRLFGAKLMRDKAESRIKEVAIEFANFIAEERITVSKVTGEWFFEDEHWSTEELFDIYIKERSKNGN